MKNKFGFKHEDLAVYKNSRHCFLPRPAPVAVGLKTNKNSCNVFHR